MYLGAQSVVSIIIIIIIIINLLPHPSQSVPVNFSSHRFPNILLKEIPLPPTPLHPLLSATPSLPSLMLGKLRSLPNKLLRDWQSNHDIQLDGLLAAQELDLLGHLEPESTVEFQVEDVAAFEVADAVFHIGLMFLVNTETPFSPREKLSTC